MPHAHHHFGRHPSCANRVALEPWRLPTRRQDGSHPGHLISLGANVIEEPLSYAS